MNFQKERDLLCEYGLILAQKGLVARTWGNLSVRSGDYMLITPSGLAYEETKPKNIVPVRISDLFWEGDQKPSSEKELHATVYRLRSDIGAVFHTHQRYASALSATRKSFHVADPAYQRVLGKTVPCASYALPTTSALARSVGKQLAIAVYPALLLANHGTVCLGRDVIQALEIASVLEEFSRSKVIDGLRITTGSTAAGEADLLELLISRGCK
jgi:L-fuculose-phosphate aldolase